MMNRLLSIALLGCLAIMTSCKAQYPDLEDGLYAEIITNKGTMIAKLHYDKVPVTVANFVALAEGNHPMVSDKFKGKPFYDSITFHRVMDKFMIQGGDPEGSGRGTPGYRFAADFDPSLSHDKPGILSMANAGGINTNGSQFFITEVERKGLDGYDSKGNLKACNLPGVSCHSVFGELVQGIEVQDSISNVKVGPGNKPVEDVVITKMNIIRKGSAAKSFNAPKVFEDEMPEVEQRLKDIMEEQKVKAEEEAEERQRKNAEAAVAVKAEFDNYNKLVKTLPSGLKIHYIKKGEGPKPAQGSFANINYQGHFTDGRLFDSNIEDVETNHYGSPVPQKVERDMYKPNKMQVSPNARLIPGFREGLLEMSVGDKVYLYIPSHLGYGERGAGGGFIPPNTDLVFVLEMVSLAE